MGLLLLCIPKLLSDVTEQAFEKFLVDSRRKPELYAQTARSRFHLEMRLYREIRGVGFLDGIDPALQPAYEWRLRRDGGVFLVLRIADRDAVDPQVIQRPGESVPHPRGIVMDE